MKQDLTYATPSYPHCRRKNKPKPPHPLQRLRLMKEAMWEVSEALLEENKLAPHARPANPPNDEALLSHMITVIRATTRMSYRYSTHMDYLRGITPQITHLESNL